MGVNWWFTVHTGPTRRGLERRSYNHVTEERKFIAERRKIQLVGN